MQCLWWFGKCVLHLTVIISLCREGPMWGARKRFASIKRPQSKKAGFRVKKCRVRHLGRSRGHSFNSQDSGAAGVPRAGASRCTAAGGQLSWASRFLGPWA